MELGDHLVHLGRAADKRAEGELVVGARFFDLLDIVRVRPDGFEHAAHASHEANLLFENLTAATLGSSLLGFLVLFGLLLLEDLVHVVLGLTGLGKLVGTTLLHKMLHHVSDLLHEEGDGPLEKVHALG